MTDIELVVVERDRQRIVPEPRRAIDELLRRIWNLVVWVVRRVGVEFNFEHREPPVLYSSASFRRAPLQYTGRGSGGGTSPDGITVISLSVACRAKSEIPSLANGRGPGGRISDTLGPARRSSRILAAPCTVGPRTTYLSS